MAVYLFFQLDDKATTYKITHNDMIQYAQLQNMPKVLQ
jgi:hypothetical protein